MHSSPAASPFKRGRTARKRFHASGATLEAMMLPGTSTTDDANAKSQRPRKGFLLGLRNIVVPILMMSFPICIFAIPLILRGGMMNSTTRPRLVVSIAASPNGLMQLQKRLESILIEQTMRPDALYLILPQKSFETKGKLIEYEPYPDYLNGLLESHPTTMQILAPTWDYGPLSDLLYAMEQERIYLDTRIVTLGVELDEEFPTGLLQALVQSSLRFPESLVAVLGGNLRHHFRQVNPIYDKFPNIYLTTAGSSTRTGATTTTKDLVVGPTCIRPKTLSLDSLYELLRDEDLPSYVRQSRDVLLSALLEQEGVPRWLVPEQSVGDEEKGTNSSFSLVSTTALDAPSWIQAIYFLQQRLEIWSDYHFLDWLQLTDLEREAILCEFQYEQDCTAGNQCVPDAESCPDAETILEALSVEEEKREEDP